MSDSTKKAQAIDRQDAADWEKRWADAANQRLMNSAKGEMSPWQAVKMAAYSIPLKANEKGGYPGWSDVEPSQTTDREKLYEDAMALANKQAVAREQVQAAMERGNESPQSMEKGREFLAQAPKLPTAWLKMYPQFQQPRSQASKKDPSREGLP